ncbi:WXG100 family type VII secretion target [Nonomuraea sp. LPB2021202275-12-8]|uniref:WXG100 family type VII secretion target n=1 Tax=Nonomuraea sp. LPB2021202275-12-8 TaxID=3120159 RepID=UPI00300D59FB
MSAELDFTRVNFGQMDLAQQDFVKIIAAFETKIDWLMTQLKTDLGTAWSGVAKATFEDHERRWNAEAAKMRSQLDELQKAVLIANENYRAAENRNKAMWYNG